MRNLLSILIIVLTFLSASASSGTISDLTKKVKSGEKISNYDVKLKIDGVSMIVKLSKIAIQTDSYYRSVSDNDRSRFSPFEPATSITQLAGYSRDGQYVLVQYVGATIYLKHDGVTYELRGSSFKRSVDKVLTASSTEFQCYTKDPDVSYLKTDIEQQVRASSVATKCVNVYLEVDYEIVADKGSVSNAETYVKSLFAEVVALYAKDGITIKLSNMFLWNTPSPYTATDSYNILTQFSNYRKSYDGDAGLLLGYRGGGGIAYVDVLCRQQNIRVGYCGIGKSFSKLPVFSFSVMVVAHELGHILGSSHTHACVWNGNGTALDKCPGSTEGGCAATENAPAGGGSIMSYCHMNSVGVNFNVGFGPQPKAVIQNRIASATCLQSCGTQPPVDPPTSTCTSISLSIAFDAFASEVSWKLVKGGVTIEASEAYTNKTTKTFTKTWCLADGSYELRVTDLYGDGICCGYGQGSIILSKTRQIIGQSSFANGSVTIPFTIGSTQPPVDPPVTQPCASLNFKTEKFASWSGGQDQGTSTISSDGSLLVLTGNAWKAIDKRIKINEQTILEFEFSTSTPAEIYGIGFDNDESISSPYTIQLAGTQVWGQQAYNNYQLSTGWKKYVIPIGRIYTGDFKYLFFASDQDEAPARSVGSFRNVKIYQSGTCK